MHLTQTMFVLLDFWRKFDFFENELLIYCVTVDDNVDFSLVFCARFFAVVHIVRYC